MTTSQRLLQLLQPKGTNKKGEVGGRDAGTLCIKFLLGNKIAG
jgi:hypothetical protein